MFIIILGGANDASGNLASFTLERINIFYAIFESVKSKTELIHVDVDIKTQKIVDIDESDINFENNPIIENIPADVIDDCFIEVVDHVEKIMKVLKNARIPNEPKKEFYDLW